MTRSKADRAAGEAVLAEYEQQSESGDDAILCLDPAHPEHSPALGYGWIKRGEAAEAPSNTDGRRLDIYGAIGLERLKPVVRDDDTNGAASTIIWFDHLLLSYTCPACGYISCEDARYCCSKAAQALLHDSRIKLAFLPANAPNSNLNERLSRFFNKQVPCNRHYQMFDDLRADRKGLYSNPQRYRSQLHLLLRPP